LISNYDGFRGLCYLAQGRCRMISRNGNLMSRFASLGEQIAASLDVGDAIWMVRSSQPMRRADHSSMTFFETRGHQPMWPSI
jgi:hypothetical protein